MIKKAVIFDFDGTIADTESIYVGNFSDTMKLYGIDCDEQDRASFRGLSPSEKIRMMMDKYHVDIDIEEATLEYRKRNEQFFPKDAKTLLFPDVEDALKQCRNHHLKLYVCSNTDSTRVEELLKQMNILSYFDGISGKDLSLVRKPSPIAYEYLLNRYGLSKDEVIAIEDSVSGLKSAQGAGIQVIALCREGSFADELYNYKIDDLSKLSEILSLYEIE